MRLYEIGGHIECVWAECAGGAAAEATYEQMWAADVAAMVGYHGGASAAAAALWRHGGRAVPGGGETLGRCTVQRASGDHNDQLHRAWASAGHQLRQQHQVLNLGLGNTGDTNVGSGNIGNTN